ncbi:PRELI-like family-domain-containing protein [Dioszegia hungarica]|uniref:PRELI-like family-domain-containing protein n=1 Tax=Dioszegia hungarica TaxID=4972 RepID=A0AA38HCW3_9TREE|nr:PRELI-like family-domain-containing protein [Dioszegia hungarica]KAI9637687.1 PRELI-like family-domain-containing protein [Dioszegia hungarica]
MVQVYRKTHEYSDPPATSILAFFLRYPNPFARHVLSVDVLSRYVHPETGRLHTQRLILKRGILPKWATSWLPISGAAGGLDAWVLEDSVVDPPGWDGRDGEPKLESHQGNLNHKKFMHVMEGGQLEAGPRGNTIHRTTAEVRSELGGRWSSMLRTKIESYGVGKFEVNSETARKGMSLVLSLLRDRQPLPDTMEFYPPPPPGFGESWERPAEGQGEVGAVTGSRRASSFFLSPGSLAWLRRGRPKEGEGEGSPVS